MPASRSWTIGSAADCDLVVDRPTVSARHCRLTRDAEGHLLEELGSANGTYVDGRRITSSARVRPQDRITLGLNVPLPWPDDDWPPGTRILRVGRARENDVVIDDPRVSEHHARVVVAGGAGPITIEDLGSTNGTSLNRPGDKITRARLQETDQVFFGSYAIPAARLLGREGQAGRDGPDVLTFRGDAMVLGRNPDCDAVLDFPMVSGRHARLSRTGGDAVIEDLQSSNGTFVNGKRVQGGPVVVRAGDQIGLGSLTLRLDVVARRDREEETHLAVPSSIAAGPDGDRGGAGGREEAGALVPLLVWGLVPAQAVVLAVLIVASTGRRVRPPITPETWWGASVGIGDALFSLGLAAIWCGGVAGLGLVEQIAAKARGRTDSEDARRPMPVWAGAAGLTGCALLLAIVHAGCGLEGPWPTMLAALALAMLSGWALGALAAPSARSTWPALGMLALATLPMVLLGGAWPPRPQLPAPLRLVGQVLPSRWAFEALLVLESDEQPTWRPAPRPGRAAGVPLDMAERIFPAESERMGPWASLLTLGACTLGLAGAGLLIRGRERPSARGL